MNYTQTTNATRHAADSYRSTLTMEELNKQFTFGHFRQLAAEVYKEVQTDKSELEQTIKKYKEDYSQKKAVDLIATARKCYDDRTEVSKDILRMNLNDVADMKRQQLRNFTLAVPKPETMNLLQAVSMRSGKLSNAEIEMLIAATASNYQALAAVHDIADRNGYSFKMPFEPAEFSKNLEETIAVCEKALDELGNEGMSFYSTELFKGKPENDGYITAKFNALDYDPATAVKLPELTLKGKIEQFIEKSKGEGNYKKAMLADDFYKSHEEELLTPEEKRSELETAVNEIIAADNG